MKMPSIFIGHGTPMNALNVNKFTKTWHTIGQRFQPKAILVVSAHWYTNGLLLQSAQPPNKINDMYGFPDDLYRVAYPVKGDLALTHSVQSILGELVHIDDSWGIDHGTWSVLTHMYPDADIPVVQLSLDRNKSVEDLYAIGKALSDLRENGTMIIASGNIVHNLRELNPQMDDKGYDWAIEFDDYIETAIINKNYDDCMNFMSLGELARLSVPSPEHYLPLLVLLGSVDDKDQVEVFNKGYDLGSLSMTGYVFTH